MKMFNAIKYLSSVSKDKCVPGLERISKLLDTLGNPQKKLKFVHVAGTNGKGSTSAFLSQILIESGYKTGLYTSPAIYCFNERIKINNKNINNEDLEEITLKVKYAADKFLENNSPTGFELMTAVAFMYFAKNNCDIVVCEVGLGGKFDATNVITDNECELSIITPIDIDHKNFLGDTIEEIATEKAGIIKKEQLTISSKQQPKAKKIIETIANINNTSINYPDYSLLKYSKINLDEEKIYRVFQYKNFNFKTQLLAQYQPQNAILAFEAALLLKTNYPNIDIDKIKKGIENTYWPGRFEIIEKNPFVIIDGGHNIQGIKALTASLKELFNNKKIIFIMSVLADKDYKQMIKEIKPIVKYVYTCTPPNPRALSAEKLLQNIKKNGMNGEVININNALKIARENSAKDDIICAFGSLYSLSNYQNKNVIL